MREGDCIKGMYRIIRPLGSGGLGTVYLAYHENLQKQIVVKKVKDKIANLVDCRIEADILKSLHHMYLPQVYDFLQLEEGVFTVMDYIPGCDLKYYLSRGIFFEESQLVFWMKQLCQVLQYLHTRKPPVLHCDIKPENIMITPEGNICLIDFNISLDGENNKDLVGVSSRYASPEQMRRAENIRWYGTGGSVRLDGRSDIYSLGAVFYEMVTGQPPRGGGETTCPVTRMSYSCSDALANIIAKAMEKNPSRRFATAARMEQALQHMEEWGNTFRRIRFLERTSDVAAAALSIVLICAMAAGWQGMRREAFFDAYGDYMQSAGRLYGGESGEEEAEAILAEGRKLLNEDRFRGMLQNSPQEKADILYGNAQAAMKLEQYGEGQDYLEEAVKLTPDNPDMWRDLAVCQAGQGMSRSAADSMEKAEQLGTSPEDAMLVKAQIAWQEQDVSGAYQMAAEAAKSQDASVSEQAAVLAVQASSQLGNREECIRLLQEITENRVGNQKIFWLRKIGELSLQCAMDGQEELLDTAWGAYEQIRQSGYAQFNDLYNLAAAYELGERLEDSRRLLEEMTVRYPQEYQVPLRLAYVIYLTENKKSVRLQDYTAVDKYYQQARSLLSEAGQDPDGDSGIVQMGEIIRQLKEQGKLSQ